MGNFKRLQARLRASPDLQRFLTERRLREAELQLAQSQAIPNASVGAGLRRLEAVDDQALMLTFSIGLPVFDRNQGNITAAMERLQRVESERRVRLIAAQTLLFATHQELLQARSQANTLEQTVIPQAQQALNEIEVGYQAGRFSFLDLAAAQREFIEVRRQAIVAAANFHRLLVEIERLTGMGFARQQVQEVTR
jgi:cobalt-zinc-cadmium efflux system outer membrane protein